MDRNQKLLSNTILYTIGGIGAKLITFLLIPVYTRYLSTAEYGIADLFYLAIQIFVTVGTLKIASSLARYAVADLENAGKYLSNALFVVLSSSVLCTIFYAFLFGNKFLDAELDISYFILFFVGFSVRELLYEMTKAVDKNRLYVIDGLFFSALLLGTTLFFVAALQRGVRGFVESYIIANFASVVFLAIGLNVRKYVSFSYINANLLFEMIKYSSLLVPATLSFWVIQTSDRYMINFFKGTSVAGIYGVAYKIPSICGMFVSFFMSAWYITAVRNESDKEYNTSVFMFYFKVVVLASSIVIIFSKLIACVMFKDEFFEAWLYVPTLIFTFVFQYLFQFLEIIMISRKATTSILVSFLVGAAINIGLNMAMIPIYGIYGAVFATGISNLIVFISRMVILQKREEIAVDYKFLIIILLVEFFIAVLATCDTLFSKVIASLLFICIARFCRDVFHKLKDRWRI